MRYAWVLIVCVVVPAGAQTPTVYSKAAVASDSMIASQVGVDIMRKGGNAVDAAVAVGFALAVTYPAAGNLGGGGFMVVRMQDGQTVAIDYRETAPATAKSDMYASRPDESLVGPRAAGVPGTPAGMWEAHRRFGRLPWRTVVEPAVELAARGFNLPYGLSESLRGSTSLFKRFSSSYALFNREGRFYAAGERFKQPELATTLARIRDGGARAFYQGPTATQIAKCGSMTLDDLNAYKVVVREPLKARYKRWEIVSMPPPSSGGVALVQMLSMLEGDDLSALGFQSSDYLHLLVESMKRAFVDRSVHMGDPGFVSVPVDKLLDPAYAAKLRKSIGERATQSKDLAALDVPTGSHESEETTHYSVVDADGNAVSNTYTLNGGYGSGFVVPGAGFLLNNEMDDFATQPGKPNMFGLIQGPKNEIQPGKRPLSSMTPTIVLEGGKPLLVLGSPGGPTIINTVLQTILNVLDFGMNVQRAVSAPRFHHQWMPDQIRWEPFGLTRDVRLALESRGHRFELESSAMGSCHAIRIDPKTGLRQVGVDPRVSTAGCAGY